MTYPILPRAILCLLAAASFFTPFKARADVRLPSIISNHMVLQQQGEGEGVWIWGKADWNEAVEVKLGGADAHAIGDGRGNWACKLTGLPAPGEPYEMTITGKNTLTIHDVIIGEVWLCSGQSNMGFVVHEAMNHDAEIAAAEYPMIRLFSVNHQSAALPEEDPKGEWRVCSPQTVGGFSAVGYFFGRELHQSLHVPVGLIDSSWGGTPAEAWTPLAAMFADVELRSIVMDYAKDMMKSAKLPLEVAEYDGELAAWSQDQTQGKGHLPKPHDPRAGSLIDHNSPGMLYNGMIAPLIPYTMRGAIWYQGESNAGRAAQYQRLLTAMIGSWRQEFASGDYPFYVVQLANYQDRKPIPADSEWAMLREAQTKVSQTAPNSGEAVCIDLGEAKNIHPTNKQEVGHRLALLAEARTYGQKIVDSGPIYRGIKVEGGKVRVSFEPSASPLTSHTGDKLKGFAVAGEDHRFAWADATINGTDVIVQSSEVSAPVAVRYAWADNPEVSLYNETGLPASPFRSDDWTSSGAMPVVPVPTAIPPQP